MDWIRRGYTKYAVLVPGQPPEKIRWVFADPGAEMVPQPHWWGSSVWDDPKAPGQPPVGDVVGRKPWSEPDNTLGYTGQGLCGDAAWGQAGFPGLSFPIITTDARGVATCCSLADVSATGGMGCGGQANWPGMQAVLAPMQGQAFVVTAWHSASAVSAGMQGQAVVVVSGSFMATVSATMQGQAVVVEQIGFRTTVSASMQGQAFVVTAWHSASAVSAGMEGQASAIIVQAGHALVSATMEGQAGATTAWHSASAVSATMQGQAFVVTVEDFVQTGDFKLSFSPTPAAGYLLCDGSNVSQSTYASLYALFGTTFGPGGVGTFALPDLRGRVPLGAGSGPGLTPRSPGDTGGEETHILTNSEVPPTPVVLTGESYAAWYQGLDLIQAGATVYNLMKYDASASPLTAAVQGGGAAHNNMQPWACVGYWFVKT